LKLTQNTVVIMIKNNDRSMLLIRNLANLQQNRYHYIQLYYIIAERINITWLHRLHSSIILLSNFLSLSLSLLLSNDIPKILILISASRIHLIFIMICQLRVDDNTFTFFGWYLKYVQCIKWILTPWLYNEYLWHRWSLCKS